MISLKTGEEEPLFKLQEVSVQIRTALDAACALSKAEQLKKGWTVITNPPTLEAWLEAHPEFKDCGPKDWFYTDVYYVEKGKKTEKKPRHEAESRAGAPIKNTSTTRVKPGNFTQTQTRFNSITSFNFTKLKLCSQNKLTMPAIRSGSQGQQATDQQDVSSIRRL
jgi:hypothetical protein